MTPWRKLRALPAADRRLLAETALLMLRVRAGLRVLSFDALRRRLERPPARRASPQHADRIAWAVAAVSRRLPGTTCLAESLTAHALLLRRGYRPELRIGVRGRGDAAGVPLDAHAWVECDGRLVAGDVDDLAAYGALRPVRPPAAQRSPTGAPAGSLTDGLAALLRGEVVAFDALGVDATDFLAACVEEDLTGLVQRRLAGRPGWPPHVRDALEREARAAAVREALRRRELLAALDALAAAGVRPILLKGTPLAYTVYDEPSLRPRSDTDLMVRRDERGAVEATLRGLGYAVTNLSDGAFLFHQFEVARDDALGVTHALDFHWKLSAESAFADLPSFDELAADAVPVPALGPHARAAGPVHALLLACVHPVMHHRNWERLIWLYDIHLLAARLPAAAFDAFAALVVRRRVAAVCARELELARTRLGTRVPDQVRAALAAAAASGEPSAAYLEPGRRWSDELRSNLGGLRWRDRLRLLREVAFPAPAYMLRAYRLGGVAAAGALLPALYVHRGLRGFWKVLLGRK